MVVLARICGLHRYKLSIEDFAEDLFEWRSVSLITRVHIIPAACVGQAEKEVMRIKNLRGELLRVATIYIALVERYTTYLGCYVRDYDFARLAICERI